LCNIPFLSTLTRSYVSVQVHSSCVNFFKSSVSAEPQFCFRMLGWRCANWGTKATH
jgi:hypothetical protein